MSEPHDVTVLLEAERSRLQQESEEAKRMLKEKTSRLRQVERALDALAGTPAPGSGITKAAVLVHLRAEVAKAPSASEEELRRAVGERLHAQGRSAVGLGLVFSRAVKELKQG